MRFILAISTALGLGVAAVAQTSGPETVDLLRLAEAFRLTQAVQTSVWPGWDATPFPVLLVAPEREFLVGYPRTPPGFTDAGYSAILHAQILTRPRQLQPNLLATFPAFGPPSVVVVGRAEATKKASTTWVLTILHEHFHQHQSADPAYYRQVEQLGLCGGDQTGMWMLNYPFPYQSTEIAERFSAICRELFRVLEQSSAPERRAFWVTYVEFLGDLSERDRRYLSFQVWQEGIARYVELRVAEAARRGYEASLEFQALPDFQPFATVAGQMRAAILGELANSDLRKQQRVSFYAFGAGLAMLLDQDVPAWKGKYLNEKFFIEKYLTEVLANTRLERTAEKRGRSTANR